MRFNKKIAGYVALAIVIILGLLFLALPPLIRHVAISKIDEATGRKSSIREVSFNPFTLNAAVSGFRLSEKGSSAPFVTFSSARLRLSPLSLPKRSFIVNEIHLDSPYVHLVRTAPNSYNFSDLVAPKKKEKEKKKEGTPLFSLNNIIIKNGSVDFEDKALKEERDHRIRGMNIAVPFVSNMPYLADRYVTPHFSAVVNDSPVRFDGRLKPLNRAVEAVVDVNLKHVDLPFYLGYAPTPLPVRVNSGRLTTVVELGYRVDAKTGPETRVAGDVALDDVAVTDPQKAPVAAVDHARLKIGEILLFARRYHLDSLEIAGVDLHVARDRSGVLNLTKIARGGKEEPAKPQEKPPAQKEQAQKPVDLRLAALSLKGAKIHLTDQVPQGGFSTELHDFDVNARNVTLAKGERFPFDLKFATSKGETATVAGEVAATPLDLQANLALNDVPLKAYYPYLQETLAAPVNGKVSFSSHLVLNDRQGLILEKSTLKGEDLSGSFGGNEGFRLKDAVIAGLTLDLKKYSALAEKADFRSGTFTLSSEKGGAISARHLLKAKLEKAPARTKRHEHVKKEAAPAFSYHIKTVSGSDLAINFTDRSKEDEPRFPLSRIKFTATGITGPKQGPIPFNLAARYGTKGSIQASGRITPEPLKFAGKVGLQGIPLRDFDAYMPEDLTIFIAGGALDTTMAVNVEKGSSGLKGNFDGSLGVRSFYCQDDNEEDLLKWERLQLDRVKGTLAPFSLAINDVALSNFYSRVIILKDGTMNLQHLTREEEAQGKTAPAGGAQPSRQVPQQGATVRQSAAPASQGAAVRGATGQPPGTPAQAGAPGVAAAPTGETAAQPHPVRIDSVTLQGGTLEFSDWHLDTPFDTTFYNLGGRVSGLSSQANRLADVDLRGNLENHSPLSIKGEINPLRGDLYLDLKIAFNDIELSPLTPYSNTYLGYEVDKGKLFLNLSYKIDKKALTSENKVFIDQFTFGKQVDSPKATKLPVRLAVALLKDRKGEIHLDLPVAGRTDDPQFSVWKVVLQILKNLLVKAATSPMALLGSMFGGGHDFSAVIFAPGSETISKPEQEKLLKLSQALHDRPALTLDLAGYVDKEHDADGYRNEVLLKKMKAEKFRRLVKQGKAREGQTQQETEILPDEYSTYLKDVYVKEKFPKPRNAVGMLKSLPDEEMKKLIITHTVVGQNELQALARERAEGVKAFLATNGKIPAERLYLKSADIYKPPAKEGLAASRVEFGANIK